jgi:predicted nicotinamide N-methyase
VKPIADRKAFIRANTSVMSPPLVPEVKLHLAHEAVPLWQKTEEELGEMGLPPPFWAFAWAGGQALARHVLDTPTLVAGKSVVDLASGSGLVGIAAMRAGAARVLCADIDGFSVDAIRLNAELNGVAIAATGEDLLLADPPACDVILVGDLFYEKDLAARVHAWLIKAEDQGSAVLIGDPGRSYLPREKLESLGEYKVRVTRDLEDSEIKWTSVWRLNRNC